MSSVDRLNALAVATRRWRMGIWGCEENFCCCERWRRLVDKELQDKHSKQKKKAQTS